MKIVLGGGIGGLSAAYYLLRQWPKEIIRIYEASGRTGGWIKSNKLPNGVIFEQGPRTIRPGGQAGSNTLKLIQDIGLANDIVPITRSHPAARNRMIYSKNSLTLLPNTIIDLFQTRPPFEKPLIYSLWKDLFTKKRATKDESIYSFVERRFGKDIAEYAISPLVCGVCAGNAKEISVKFLMNSLFEKEQKYGGITKGYFYSLFGKKEEQQTDEDWLERNYLADKASNEGWSIYSFKKGLEVLPNTLAEYITANGVGIDTNKMCEEIKFYEDEVALNIDGKEKLANHVISSIPANGLANLVDMQHPTLADHLRKIPAVTVGVVNLQYNLRLENLREAFGFLVPPSENIPILGVIFDSCCFPESENTVLTVMMGGHWFEKYFGSSPGHDMLLDTAIQHVDDILGVNIKPDNYKVHILKDCIPQYIVGHHDRIQAIEDYIKKHKLPLSICGSSFYGVGVNDVIFGARRAVMNINVKH